MLISADSFNVLVARPSPVVDRAELYTLHFTRHAPGSESKRPADVTNPLDGERLGLVFNQDVRIMSRVQRGMAQQSIACLMVTEQVSMTFLGSSV